MYFYACTCCVAIITNDFHIHSCTKPSGRYMMVYYSTFSAFCDCECSLNDRLCYTLTYIARSVHVISMDAQLLKKWMYRQSVHIYWCSAVGTHCGVLCSLLDNLVH